jgi:hypothetical protein
MKADGRSGLVAMLASDPKQRFSSGISWPMAR